MSDVAIRVENISKRYTIGKNFSGSLRETLAGLFGSRNDAGLTEEFHALQDVSFEVKRGEAMGIIGKNGAGKSTLLKVLSRITEPTTGRIEIDGRVSSLLEVGTGFHPELTGRENVFLNGTILGMSRAEVKRKFDEIVDFSGVERFLDTPVKRYSSGMTVRLAFAVAAHLEPEILIIDEVLAVGDAEFQKKCLGKMEDVAGEGRTVLFVSHNMGAVKQLCTRGILLEHGRVVAEDEIYRVVDLYQHRNQVAEDSGLVRFEPDPTKSFQLMRAMVANQKAEQKKVFECEEDIYLLLTCRTNDRIPGLYGYLAVKDQQDNLLIETDTFDHLPNALETLPLGTTNFRLRIPRRTLAPGRYRIYLNFASKHSMDGFNVDSPGDILSFDVVDTFTVRGNNRRSFLGTTLVWEPAKTNAPLQKSMIK